MSRQLTIYSVETATVDRLSRRFGTRRETEDYLAEVGERWGVLVPEVQWRSSSANYSVACLDTKTMLLLPRHKLVSVVLHELAHFIVGEGHGHDGVWMSRYLELIRGEMGINAWAEFRLALNESGIAA